jgi:hypothetical protein
VCRAKEVLMRILTLAILAIGTVLIGPAAAQTYDPKAGSLAKDCFITNPFELPSGLSRLAHHLNIGYCTRMGRTVQKGYQQRSSYPGITPEIAASGVEEALKVTLGKRRRLRAKANSAYNVQYFDTRSGFTNGAEA